MGKIFHTGPASGEMLNESAACPMCRGSDDADYSWTEGCAQFDEMPDGLRDGHAKAWVAAPDVGVRLPDDYIRDYAIEMLGNISAARAAGQDARPFFLAVGFHKPHLPFVFPERFLSYYPETEIQLPTNPDVPIDMPFVAWDGYGELRQCACTAHRISCVLAVCEPQEHRRRFTLRVRFAPLTPRLVMLPSRRRRGRCKPDCEHRVRDARLAPAS